MGRSGVPGSSPVHMVFVVSKVALGQVSLPALRFSPCKYHYTQHSIFIYNRRCMTLTIFSVVKQNTAYLVLR
jgi:hypothetical protein